MIKFSEEKLAKVKEIMARYPEGKQKSALLPVLHVAQDAFGAGSAPKQWIMWQNCYR